MKSDLILSFDTTGLQDSIAIGIGLNKNDPIDSQLLPQGGSQRQSAYLITDLQSLLQKHHSDFKDIVTLCTLTGPGSFTGIRIGLAAAQGFLIANKCQIFAPSTLDLLLFIAVQSTPNAPHNIMALVDSKRGDFFAQKSTMDTPEIITKEEVSTFSEQGGLLISSTPLLLEDGLPLLTPQRPLAEHLIEFYRHHASSSSAAPLFQELSPCYIRNPEFAKKKRMNTASNPK